MATHGQYTHIEIPYDDEGRAKRFYSAVFGWTFEAMPGYEGYSTYTCGPGDLGGGIGKRGVSAPTAIRNYIEVADIGAALATAAANGGSVVVASTDMGFGWYAAVLDSEGNEIGLYQTKPSG